MSLLVDIFHGPLRFLRWWGLPVNAYSQRKREHPNGGVCWTCGERSDADATECDDYWQFRQI